LLSARFIFATAQTGTMRRWLWGSSSQPGIDTIHGCLAGESQPGNFTAKAGKVSSSSWGQGKIFQKQKKKVFNRFLSAMRHYL